MISDSMQMYLVTIAREQDHQTPVPLSELSRVLSISPVSVNEMCRKLQDSGMVSYLPYKGVSLTDQGEVLARSILRKHRLWEVFLVEKLGMAYEHAHDAACGLEHTTSNLLADHLDRFLEFPASNPIGKPIPRSSQSLPEQETVPLSKLTAGSSGMITVIEAEEGILSYLEEHGLRPGAAVLVQASSADSVLLKVDEKDIALNGTLMGQIHITTLPSSEKNQPTGQINPNQSETMEEPMRVNKQSTIHQIPLSELKKGQTGVVVHVGGKGAARRRMLDMGLVTGSEVSVVRVAPLGDPIEYSLKGYSLSLRKSEASAVQVEIPDDPAS